MAKRPPASAGQAQGDAQVQMPVGLHQLSRESGTLSCARCRRAAGPGRWYVLAFKSCPAELDPESGEWTVPPCTLTRWTWTRTTHRVQGTLGHAHCSRCQGSVPAHRAAVFRRSRCPAWLVEPVGGSPSGRGGTDWGQQVHALLGARSAGQRRQPLGRGPAAASPMDSGVDAPQQLMASAATASRARAASSEPGARPGRTIRDLLMARGAVVVRADAEEAPLPPADSALAESGPKALQPPPAAAPPGLPDRQEGVD